MRNILFAVLLACLISPAFSQAGFLDNLFQSISGPSKETADESTIVSGLKEALSIGTENAVRTVSQVDGYFGNEIIRILMPEKMRTVADILSTIGFREDVDEFMLGMNRAAERAAPKAAEYFVDSIKEMTFEDAAHILNGGDTAATEYFRDKTSGKIYDAFKPIISSSMNEVGATRMYKDLMARYETVPFVDRVSVDLDDYVTTKAMDGLFYMVGEEERKIRTDPAARVTELLQKVFSK